MTSSLILQRAVRPRLARSLYGASAFSTAATPSSSTSDTDSLPQLPPFDYQPKPYAGPTADEVLAKRKKFLCPSIYHFYQKPVNIVEGKMHYLFDESGRRYLDAIAGIVTVSYGHCHPDVLKAITEQSKLLQHATTVYLHHAIGDFAEALASKMSDLKSLLSLKEGVQFYCKSCEGTLTRAPIR